MQAWYKVATPRKEVREGRSFNPDEFAIHLEQVVAGSAPTDYRDPAQFFARTCFTRALREHVGMVLRRLSGITANTAPVLTLITQFGGGKTHTLTTLYHLARCGQDALKYSGVAELLNAAGLSAVPEARVAVFVGNAWDPQDGRETPWIDIAYQLAGEAGIRELGAASKTAPPGTEALTRVFKAAGRPVLLLFDEVLNFLNRHRGMTDSFYAFLQNLTVATTGITHGAAVISLPRSQVEMTDWDMQWQDRITKVVRRVAKDLIANDETEISEVVRRRLFEDIGSERIRNQVANKFAEWCFERRSQIPAEWTAVDTATTEVKAKDHLRRRFEACYPFHPATLSVFQRKWQALPQYQQTRGTLAMLAQWISWAYRTGFTEARNEPLITLGSAPLEVPEFRSIVLGQLGESRLVAAIDADISGEHSHARALDADTKGLLKDIHRRVGTVILFESSGGQVDKVAHLPELRFALGEPGLDTTSVDNAAFALERRAYFIRRVGSDGFKISHRPTLKKVVSDRRASLDEESEIRPAMRELVKREFKRGARVPLVCFPQDSTDIPDVPRLTLVIVDPETEWIESEELKARIADWTRQRGSSARLYPAALVWCFKKPGRELRDKVELWLAWQRVEKEVMEGTLGEEFDRRDQQELRSNMDDAEEAAKEEVWGSYKFIVISDNQAPQGLRVLDLGAGHSSSSDTLSGRIISALNCEGLLSESVGATYIERHWPPAFRTSGAWPLSALRQAFLNGSLIRLLEADETLRDRIVEFVAKGDFGLGYDQKPDGTYGRVAFREVLSRDDVTFESDVFLLTRERAQALKVGAPAPVTELPPPQSPISGPESGVGAAEVKSRKEISDVTICLEGSVPPELWNRLGTKIIPPLRSQANDLRIELRFTWKAHQEAAQHLVEQLRSILQEMQLESKIRISIDSQS